MIFADWLWRSGDLGSGDVGSGLRWSGMVWYGKGG